MYAKQGDENSPTVSIETIYQYVYRQQKHGDKIHVKLRRKRKKRRKRLKKNDGRGKIPNKTMIDKRPKIVDDKGRFGDWEGDTIIGKDHQIGPPMRCHFNISRTQVKVYTNYSTCR